MSFEKVARDFCTELCDKVGKTLRGLVREFAEEEQHHYELNCDLSACDDIQQYADSTFNAPTNDHKFSGFIQLPDLVDKPDDHDVLRYSPGREQAAME